MKIISTVHKLLFFKTTDPICLLNCVPCVLKTCSRAKCLRGHVPTCLACWRVHVPTCLACLSAQVPTCLASLLATCLVCSCTESINRPVFHHFVFLFFKEKLDPGFTVIIELFVTLSSKTRSKMLECSSTYPRPWALPDLHDSFNKKNRYK